MPRVIVCDVNETLLDVGEGKVLYPLGPKPDITGPDFRSVANQIVATESRTA